jgi:hypothetical protein
MMQNDSSDAGPMCPTTAAEALGSSSSWSASSCGVDIRRCLDDRAKGMGAFATRHIRASSMVGCYWGEWLTRREAHIRHGWKNGARVDDSDLEPLERTALEMREERLGSLVYGAPLGGASNGGRYFFELGEPGSAWQQSGASVDVVGIDGEDPTRSSWCRYINHAPPYQSNLRACIDRRYGRIWFEAKRDIEVDEELTFTYSDDGVLAYAWRRFRGVLLCWAVVAAGVVYFKSSLVAGGGSLRELAGESTWLMVACALAVSAAVSVSLEMLLER